VTFHEHKIKNDNKELFENVIEGIFHSTLDGHFLAVNPVMVRIFGYGSQKDMVDLVNSSKQFYVNENDRQFFIQELLENGVIEGFEAKYYRKDKSIIWTRTNAHTVKNGNGQILFFEGFLFDITHQKRIEHELIESEERYRKLVAISPEAIFIYSDEKLVFVNSAAIELLGAKTMDQLLGKPILDFVYSHEREAGLKQLENASKTGKTLPLVDEKFICLDGTIIDVEVRSQYIIFEGKPAYQVFVRDITELKKSDAALKRQLIELSIVHNISSVGAVSTDIDTIIEQATQTLKSALEVDNCGILLLSEDGNSLKPHPSYWGTSVEQIENLDVKLPISQGISGKVVTTGRPIRADDVSQDSDYYKVTENIKSELCVPIVTGGNIIGVLNAESVHSNAFSIADERLFNTIAGNLGAAIERIRLFDSEKQRRYEAELLREATTAMTTSLDLDKLLDTVLDSLEKIVSFDSASITLEQEGEMEIIVGRGFPQELDVIGQRLPKDGKWKQLAKEHRPLILSDAQKDPDFVKWDGSEYIHGWMGVPLVVNDKVIGIINLDSKGIDAFSEKDAVIVQTFANSAAVSIENARLFETEQKNRNNAEIIREATTALNVSLNLSMSYTKLLLIGLTS